jgi:hypothetical protein
MPVGHDDDVGHDVAAGGHLQAPPALGLVDPRELRARAHRHSVLFEPALHEPRARVVDHPRQDARRDLDDRELGTQCQNRVEDRERDEAGADHDDVAAGLDLRQHAAALLESPERMDTRPVGAGHRRAHRGRAGGDQAIVVLDRRAVVERAAVRRGVERGGALAELRGDAPVGEHARGRGEHMRLGDRAVEIVRQDHP